MHCHWSLFWLCHRLVDWKNRTARTVVVTLNWFLRYDTICVKPNKYSTTYHTSSPLHSLHMNQNFFNSMCNPLQWTRQNIISIKTQILTKNAPSQSKQSNENGKNKKIRKERAWPAAHCTKAEKQRIKIFSFPRSPTHKRMHTNTNQTRQKKASNIMIEIGLHALQTLQIPSYENNPFAFWIRWWCCKYIFCLATSIAFAQPNSHSHE